MTKSLDPDQTPLLDEWPICPNAYRPFEINYLVKTFFGLGFFYRNKNNNKKLYMINHILLETFLCFFFCCCAFVSNI